MRKDIKNSKDINKIKQFYVVKPKRNIIIGITFACVLFVSASLVAGHYAFKASHPTIQDDGKVIVDPTIEDAVISQLKTTEEGNKVATVTSKKEIFSIKVTINGVLLKNGEEYEFSVSNENSNAVVLIYKKTFETHSGQVLITPVYNEDKPAASLVGISATFKTTKDYFLNDSINKSEIKVLANYSDKTIKEIADSYWRCDDFGEETSYKFVTLGNHVFNISYENFNTTLTINVKRPAPIGRLYVHFNSNGGTYVEPQELLEGERAIKPLDVHKYKTEDKDTEYILTDWYENPDFSGEPFNFEATKIHNDITLYAKWDIGFQFQMKEVFAPLYDAKDHYQFRLPCKTLDKKYNIESSAEGCPVASIDSSNPFLINVDGEVSAKMKELEPNTTIYASTVYKGHKYCLDKMTIKNVLVNYVEQDKGIYSNLSSLVVIGGDLITRELRPEELYGKLPENIVIPSMFQGKQITTMYNFGLAEIDPALLPSHSNFKNIIISEGIENIDELACTGLFNLESIYIPKNIKSIKEFSFASCINLKDVYVSSTAIANLISEDARYDHTGLLMFTPFKSEFNKPEVKRNIHLDEDIYFSELADGCILKENYSPKNDSTNNLLSEKRYNGKLITKQEWLFIYENYSKKFQTLASSEATQYKISDLTIDTTEVGGIEVTECRYESVGENIWQFNMPEIRSQYDSYGGGAFEFNLFISQLLVEFERETTYKIWYQILNNGNISIELINYLDKSDHRYKYFEFNSNGYVTREYIFQVDKPGDVYITYPEE